jgi:hypothetical protein
VSHDRALDFDHQRHEQRAGVTQRRDDELLGMTGVRPLEKRRSNDLFYGWHVRRRLIPNDLAVHFPYSSRISDARRATNRAARPGRRHQSTIIIPRQSIQRIVTHSSRKYILRENTFFEKISAVTTAILDSARLSV